MLRASFSRLLLGLSFFVSASVLAAPVTYNFTNIESHGNNGDPANVVDLLEVGANATITSIAYDVTLTTFGLSWLSEMAVVFESTDFIDGVLFTPGFADDGSGTRSYRGSVDLIALGLDFAVGADGLLRIEFFENFDDFLGADGVWSGSFTFGVDNGEAPSPVPEPASALLLALGLAGMRLAGRRHRH